MAIDASKLKGFRSSRPVAILIVMLTLLYFALAGVAEGDDETRSAAVAAEAAHWPIRMQYDLVRMVERADGKTQRQRAQYLFSGNSWSDWYWEATSGEIAGECVAFRDGEWLSGIEGCSGSLQRFDEFPTGSTAGPTWFLHQGAAALYSDLVEVDKPVGAAARTRDGEDVESSRSAVKQLATPGARSCTHPKIEMCPQEADGETLRVTIDQQTGMILRLERAVDGIHVETMVVRKLELG